MVRFTDEEGNRSQLNIPVSTERPRISMTLRGPSELYDDDFSWDNMDFVGGGMEEYDPRKGPKITTDGEPPEIQSHNRGPHSSKTSLGREGRPAKYFDRRMGGKVPHGSATTVQQPFYRMPPSLRDEANQLLLDKRPGEVASAFNDRSPSVTSRAIYDISKSMRPPSHRRMHMYKDEFVHPRPRDPNRPQGLLPPNPVDGGHAPGPGVHKPRPRFSAAGEAMLRKKRAAGGEEYDGYNYDESGEPYIDVVADASIEENGHRVIMNPVKRLTEVHGEDETVDYLWRLIMKINGRKVLDNIRRDFGVAIGTNDLYQEEMGEVKEEMGEGEGEGEGEMRVQQAAMLASTVASTPLPSGMGTDRSALLHLIKTRQVQLAFETVLNQADESALQFVCRQIDPDELFGNGGDGGLSQPVLLSLLQQLSYKLDADTDLKFRYIEHLLEALQPYEESISVHVPKVVSVITDALNEFQLRTPNASLKRQARVITQLVRNLRQ